MYPELRTRPIPFVDPLRAVAAAAAASPVALRPVSASPVVAPLRTRFNAGAMLTQPRVRADAASRQVRTAQARYDGTHSLNVRSCTTGQVYRFSHPGAVVTIDAADISLMKRIEQVTVLA